MGIVGSTAVAFLLLLGGCTSPPETYPTATPTADVTPASPTPSLVASPTDPSGCGPNPVGVPTPNFVVGNRGLNGPEIFVESTRQFSLANNDTREHRVDLFRLPDPTEPWTREGLLRLVRRGDWPSEGVRLLSGGPRLSSLETWRECTAPLKAGYYALVDRAVDLRTGRAYSQQLPFVWVVRVIPPS